MLVLASAPRPCSQPGVCRSLPGSHAARSLRSGPVGIPTQALLCWASPWRNHATGHRLSGRRLRPLAGLVFQRVSLVSGTAQAPPDLLPPVSFPGHPGPLMARNRWVEASRKPLEFQLQ